MKTKTANSTCQDILGNGNCTSDQRVLTTILRQWRQTLGYCSIFATIPACLATHVSEARSDGVKRTEAIVAGRGARPEKLNKSYCSPALLKRQSKFLLPHQKGGADLLAPLGGNDDCPGRSIPGGTYTAAAPYVDSGNTSGSNDTVGSVYVYSFGYQTVHCPGPDHVYSFTLSSRAGNPQIEISATSGEYSPLIYILDGEYRDTCPAVSGSHSDYGLLFLRSSFGGSAVIDGQLMNYLPLNVPLYLFIDSEAGGGSGPYTIRMQDVTIAPECSSSNLIDCPDFFVHQHYVDFLSRTQDAGGQAYWTNRITECGSDLLCIHDRRIGVSAAFFVEQEFQESGYYIYRFYKASFGRQPTFSEFMNDRYQVIGGTNLEARKEEFATRWVQRSDFITAYPNTLSNTEFVNKLFASAGLTSSRYDPQKQQEILALNSGLVSRAHTLRDVIEIPDFKNIPDPNDPRYNELKQISQYNPAFVLMQYFGYLRRNVDQDGYAFWLDILNNREPNNFRAMVCAFITSSEYQLRFGAAITRSNADCAQ